MAKNKEKNEIMQGESKRRRNDELSREELIIISNMIEVDYSFDELVDMFIDDCKLRNLREHTIKYYRSELSAFLCLPRQSLFQGFGLAPSLQRTGNTSQ